MTIHDAHPYVRIAIGLAAILMIISGLWGLAAPADAQYNNTTEEYYNNTGTTVENASWMQNRTDPTLVNSTHMLSRIGGVTVGTDATSASSVLVGLMAFAALVSITGRSSMGIVGGSVVGVITMGALTTAGYSPDWLWVGVLFALGLVAFVVLKRGLR